MSRSPTATPAPARTLARSEVPDLCMPVMTRGRFMAAWDPTTTSRGGYTSRRCRPSGTRSGVANESRSAHQSSRSGAPDRHAPNRLGPQEARADANLVTFEVIRVSLGSGGGRAGRIPARPNGNERLAPNLSIQSVVDPHCSHRVGAGRRSHHTTEKCHVNEVRLRGERRRHRTCRGRRLSRRRPRHHRRNGAPGRGCRSRHPVHLHRNQRRRRDHVDVVDP